LLNFKRNFIPDSAAVAAILYKRTGSFEYVENEGFKVVTVVQTRIKIYKRKDMIGQIKLYDIT
jgi:hypothetical protein